MATSDADLWHQVHAQREDGVPAMFLIRDVEPRPDQPQIFVIEMPYPISDLSKLPDDAGYRRLERFQDEWIEPACEALGWTFVAWKSEDGSFSFYLYGDGDPNALLAKLAPFDGALSFFHDRDADWSEYAGLRELVEQAEAADEVDDEGAGDHVHTGACDHDHDGDTHDGDAMSHVIEVVDLTGERPAGAARAGTGKPGKATSKTAKPRAAKPKPRATKAAARPASKKAAARPASKKAAARPASKKAAKPAPAKATAKRPVAKPSATRTTANRAGAKKPASKPAARKSAKSER